MHCSCCCCCWYCIALFNCHNFNDDDDNYNQSHDSGFCFQQNNQILFFNQIFVHCFHELYFVLWATYLYGKMVHSGDGKKTPSVLLCEASDKFIPKYCNFIYLFLHWIFVCILQLERRWFSQQIQTQLNGYYYYQYHFACLNVQSVCEFNCECIQNKIPISIKVKIRVELEEFLIKNLSRILSNF